MNTNLTADEEMLRYLRERSTNYPGTNHGADDVSAWALAEIERLREENKRLSEALRSLIAKVEQTTSALDVPAERACKGGGKCPEPTWCSQEQACLWDRWNK